MKVKIIKTSDFDYDSYFQNMTGIFVDHDEKPIKLLSEEKREGKLYNGRKREYARIFFKPDDKYIDKLLIVLTNYSLFQDRNLIWFDTVYFEIIDDYPFIIGD